jgi:hypothetical protein
MVAHGSRVGLATSVCTNKGQIDISNKLNINTTKCCYMYFKPKSAKIPYENQDLRLEIDSFVLKKCTETRFLGLTIDEQLNWDAHIKHQLGGVVAFTSSPMQ